MHHPTQPHRFAALETPLGEDRLLLVEASVSESLAQPFVIEIEAVSLEPIRPEELLGRKITLRLDLEEGGARYFNGHVFRVGEEEPEGRFWPYTLTVRPWLWFLTRTADCRIFQHKTVPEIVQAIFREHGFTDFEDKLSGNYPRLEYCVQYRETDFNFIQRLLEQEGIYYYFRHEQARHVLILADAPEAHEEIPGKIGYHLAGGAAIEEPHIMSFRTEKVVRPGRVILNDFDFEKPNAKLEAQSAEKRPHERSDFEVYDYPGEYTEVDQGERYARVRIEELQARYEEARGGSDVRLFSAGRLFQLACRDPEMAARLDGKYLLVEVHHTFSTGGYFSDEPGGESYHNSFTAIPARVPFRPERRTPKPVIQGPQTAIVVGPKGEEIHTDEYGRVKVQFHWDRYGKRDENSSCWVRVAQVWAGKNWGGIHIPRIGQEVIVEFLEGDPDQPIITGRVYNAEQMPPYDLPAHKTRSGIKSRSSKGGSPSNFNEIRFEDKKGQEEILIHAERNHRIEVEKDESHWVGGDREKTIDGDETTTVKGDRNETVKKNESVVIEQTRTAEVKLTHSFTVGTDETYEVQGNRRTTIGAADVQEVRGGRNETIHAQWAQLINGPWGQTINGAWTQNIHGPWSQTVNGSVTLTATGGFNIIAPGGTNIVDFKLLKTGGTLLEGYAAGLDFNINSTALNASSFGSTGLKLEHTGIAGSVTNVTLHTPTTKVEQAAALAALSSATGIEMDTLKVFL